MELFIVWLIFAGLVGLFANTRGRSGIGFFLIAVILSPLIGLLWLLFTKNLAEDKQRTIEAERAHQTHLESIRAVAPQASMADELAKLAKLKADGILNDAEFDEQKARLLGAAKLKS